jgi:pyridoxine 5'-phosphate synthase PdxJ
MAKLGVNIDHVATLRQARCVGVPDPVELALIAESAGADAVTVHLREDRRHIQDEDLRRLRKAVKTRLNLEMACTDAMVSFALKLNPDDVCLVPEKRREKGKKGVIYKTESSEKALLDSAIGLYDAGRRRMSTHYFLVADIFLQQYFKHVSKEVADPLAHVLYDELTERLKRYEVSNDLTL